MVYFSKKKIRNENKTVFYFWSGILKKKIESNSAVNTLCLREIKERQKQNNKNASLGGPLQICDMHWFGNNVLGSSKFFASRCCWSTRNYRWVTYECDVATLYFIFLSFFCLITYQRFETPVLIDNCFHCYTFYLYGQFFQLNNNK